MRALLSGREGISTMDNLGMMSAMFDMVEGVVPPAPSMGNECQTTMSFLRSSGESN